MKSGIRCVVTPLFTAIAVMVAAAGLGATGVTSPPLVCVRSAIAW